MALIKFTNICWDVDDATLNDSDLKKDFIKEVDITDIPDSELNEYLSNWLSETYGFDHTGFGFEVVGNSNITESKFNKLFNFIMISEGRKDNLTYEEKKAKGVITSVSVKVTGSSADKINRLVAGIEECRNLADEYTAKCKELTAEAKSYSAEFFNEEDRVLSRVIETSKSIITFSKVVPKLELKTSKDYEKLEQLVVQIAELIKDQQDDLCTQLKAMIDQCDWITEKEEWKTPAEKVTTKSVVTEGVKVLTDKFIKLLKTKATIWLRRFNKFIEKFDTRQQKIDELFSEIL